MSRELVDKGLDDLLQLFNVVVQFLDCSDKVVKLSITKLKRKYGSRYKVRIVTR